MKFGMKRSRIRDLSAVTRAVMCAVFLLLLTLPAFAAVIEGRVTDARNGEPLAGVTVQITGWGSVETDSEGYYRRDDLSSGFYSVYVEAFPGYVGKIYGNSSWCISSGSYIGCPVDSGEGIYLDTHSVASGIDLALEPTVLIRGTVVDAQTRGPLDAGVTTFVCPEELFGCLGYDGVRTDAEGRYEVEAPRSREVYLTSGADGYLGELFDDKLCGEWCDVRTGDPVDTSEGQSVEGIDFDLVPVNSIRGRLTAETTGEPIQGSVWAHVGETVLNAFSDADGYYEFLDLANGTYFLRSFVNEGHWAQELYDDVPCPQSDSICDVTRGTAIELTGGTHVEDIDFALSVGGSIQGRVFGAVSGQGVEGGRVIAYDQAGHFMRGTRTDADGYYTLSGLAAAQYMLVTEEVYPYNSQVYEGVPCTGLRGECDPSLGTPVAVELGQTVEGIDFALDRNGQCEASDTRLCLNQGRFAVDLEWTYKGDTALAQAQPLDFADDSGYFWFFDERNVEVTVKVLNACNTDYNNFWVFAAGLTHLEARLTVTDTYTGQTQTYDNPPSEHFQPILDTQAFDTCFARDRARAAASEVPSEAPLVTLPATVAMSQSLDKLTPPPPTCVSAPGVLCLRGGRFQVEAIWEKPNGEIGPAMAESLTDETGMFWFFQSDNLEMVIKILSNCGGHTNRYWVFTAGLTNLGVKWRVTDLWSGTVKDYDNAVRSPFLPIFDTDAFACP